MARNGWHGQFQKSPASERTSKDGIVFHSKAEMKRWEQLRLLERAGKIKNLRRQVAFPLVNGDIIVRTPTGRVSSYTADFVYHDYDDARGWYEP